MVLFASSNAHIRVRGAIVIPGGVSGDAAADAAMTGSCHAGSTHGIVIGAVLSGVVEPVAAGLIKWVA